jgi:hypothetical protein
MEDQMSDQPQFSEPEQERARTLLQAIDVSAPPALRATVEEQIHAAAARRRRPGRPWSGLRWPVALPAAALAAAVVAIVLMLSGGAGRGGPALGQAAALALSRPTQSAPADNGRTLEIASAVPFPYWGRTVGWRAVGSRVDTLAGRKAVTVFYSAPGRTEVGYTIVSGRPLPVRGGTALERGGVRYAFLNQGSGRLVTWRRQGHTCVIAGRAVNRGLLLKLAMVDIPQ